ncbi:MAG TPA: hypothetical protein VM012_14975, partial [Flavitalea sp.]|nr:hypothetical protein [Flavitalea sp.]
KNKKDPQKQLFIELTETERSIVNLLQEKNPLSIDEINLRSHVGASAIAAALLNLEMQNVVHAAAGKMYSLV